MAHPTEKAPQAGACCWRCPKPLEWGANCDRKQTKTETDEQRKLKKLRCAAPPILSTRSGLNAVKKELSELPGKSLLLPEESCLS